MAVSVTKNELGEVEKYIPGTMFGKHTFNPPEIYTHCNQPPGLDPEKVDVFQLGCCLYMMVTAGRWRSMAVLVMVVCVSEHFSFLADSHCLDVCMLCRADGVAGTRQASAGPPESGEWEGVEVS